MSEHGCVDNYSECNMIDDTAPCEFVLASAVNPLFPLLSPLFQSSLLKEAEIHAEQREFELNRRRQMGLSASHHSLDNIEFDNKEDDQHDQRLLSQFGIWFLVCNQRALLLLITGD